MADPMLSFQGSGERPFLHDYTNYGSMADWWNSLTSPQQIQAGMLGATGGAKQHFNIPLGTDTGLRPSGYVSPEAWNSMHGGPGMVWSEFSQSYQPAIRRPDELNDLWGAGNLQMPAGSQNLLNPNGPTHPTIQPELTPITPTPTPNVPPPSIWEPQPATPYPTNPELPRYQPPVQQQPQYQPQQGLFSPNTNVPGGWEAIMHQQFNQMPHIANPRAPEVTLGGSWLNAGDTMRIPSNLMSNVPGLFGGMNQQTQWGGYWGPELTGLVGPHGIAPGYGYYNSNSPVNYTGLFAQSNPFWGNPVASPAFPTPSPQTLSPYHGVGPDSHFGQYFQRMRQNAGTLQQTREAQEQDRQQQQVDWQYAMYGCDQGDDACLRQARLDYG